MKAKDRVYDVLEEGTLELGSAEDLLIVYSIYNTGERSEPEKNYNNKIKTTIGPPLLRLKHPHKTPPLTNLRGGPDPRSPPSGSAHEYYGHEF